MSFDNSKTVHQLLITKNKRLIMGFEKLKQHDVKGTLLYIMSGSDIAGFGVTDVDTAVYIDEHPFYDAGAEQIVNPDLIRDIMSRLKQYSWYKGDKIPLAFSMYMNSDPGGSSLRLYEPILHHVPR